MLKLYPILGAVAAALVVIGVAYYVGRTDEAADAKSKAREQLVDQITERGKIDDDVKGMSASDVCRKLDGVWNNGKCE